MDVVKAANLALRFLLELCALAALAYWGATSGYRLPIRIVLAIVTPVVAAVAWGLFVSPRATIDASPWVRLLVELLVFGGGVAGLLQRGQLLLGLLLAVIYVINRALIAVWDQ